MLPAHSYCSLVHDKPVARLSSPTLTCLNLLPVRSGLFVNITFLTVRHSAAMGRPLHWKVHWLTDSRHLCRSHCASSAKIAVNLAQKPSERHDEGNKHTTCLDKQSVLLCTHISACSELCPQSLRYASSYQQILTLSWDFSPLLLITCTRSLWCPACQTAVLLWTSETISGRPKFADVADSLSFNTLRQQFN